MVDLTGGDGDRGQVLLVTTFGIAVLFVALALVLNASAYSQATATSHGDGSHDAVAFSTAAVDGVEGTLAYVNRHNDTDYAALRTELDEGVTDWSESADGYAARRGGRATVSITGTTNGSRITQANESRALTNAAGADNWTLADGVSGTSDARLNLSRTALVAPGSVSDTDDLLDAETFHLAVTDGGDVWRLFVYRSGGDVVVRVADESGSLQPACTVSPGGDGYAVVDLSNGSVEGTACPQIGGFDAVGSDSELAYRWGSHAAGTYTLLVDRPSGDVADGDYGLEADGEPYVRDRVYRVSIRVSYATPRVEYVTETAVTAGDTDA